MSDDKKKECPYCKNDEPLPITGDSDDYLCLTKIVGNSLWIRTYDYYGNRCTEEQVINFCPMCGRKLKD